MTLDQAVALSLIPELPRVGLTERLRADDPGPARTRAHAVRRSASRAAARRSGGHPRAGVERSAVSRRAARHVRRAAGALVPRHARRAASARRRDRRLARRVGRRARDGAAARRRPRRARHHRRQRPGARRRLGRASRRARHGPDDRRARLRRRSHLSARARDAGRARSPRDGLVRQRVSAGHAAAAVSLSDAQPADQRPVARGRRDRGVREVGLAHHRRVRARTGARGHGRAGQRAERPQPRRARADPGRGKDCGVLRTISWRSSAGAGGGQSSRERRSSDGRQAGFRRSAAASDGGRAGLRSRRAGGRIGPRRPCACCRVCSSSNCAGCVRRVGGGRFMRPS